MLNSEKDKTTDTTNKRFMFAPIIQLLLMLGMIIYGLNRGIDITDESFYIMGYAHPEETRYGISEFQKIIPAVIPLDLSNMVQARISRLLITLLSCMIFALAWGRYQGLSWCSREVGEAMLWAGLFSLATYMFGPPSVSYNSFSSAGILMTISLGIALLKESSMLVRLSGTMLTGILCVLLFYIKFSNALAGPATLVVLLILRERGQPFKQEIVKDLILSLSFFSGILIWIMFHFGSISVFSEYTSHYIQTVQNMAASDSHHGLDAILERYRLNLSDKLTMLESNWITLLAGFISLWYATAKPSGKRAWWGSVIFILVIMGHIFNTLIPIDKIKEEQMIDFYLLSLLPLMAVEMSRAILQREFRETGLLLLPLGGILCGSAGTNNALTTQWLVYLNLIGIAGFMSIKFMSKNHQSHLSKSILAVLGAGIIIQLYTGYFLHPYRIQGSLNEQNTEIRNGPFKGMQVEKNLAELISSLQNDLAKYSPREKIEGIYTNAHEIGLVYALGGIVPSVAWNTPKNGIESVRLLKQSNLSIDAILTSDLEPLSPEVIQELKSRNLHFPDSFIKTGDYDCHIAGFNRKLSFYVRRSAN